MTGWLRTAGAAALAMLALAGVAQAQTVDEIVARNLQARGGVEKLKAMTSAKITGDVDQQGRKIHIVNWAKRPNSMRREMEATPPPPSPGRVSIPGSTGTMKAVIATDGAHVWTISPMSMGAEELTGPQADGMKVDADFDSVLLDYKAKGTAIQLVGTEPINGKPAYHLKITKKSGQVQRSYLDTETALEVRTSSDVEQDGTKMTMTTDLSNYQTVEGLSMPFTMKQSVNGQPVAEITITKMEINIPVDDGLFKMPAKN